MPRTLMTFWIAALVGCGSNSPVAVNDSGAPGVPPPVRSDVDPNKGLGTLTPTEVDKLCETTKMFARVLVENEIFRDVGCRVTGITATLTLPDDPPMVVMACKTAYDACKAVPPASTIPGMCPTPDATCMATVREYEACLNELPTTTDTLNRLIPKCEMVNRQSLAALLLAVGAIGPSCQTLNQKCPGVLGGLGMPVMPPRP